MIAIVDYGMGNLRSVQKAIERVGGKAKITQAVNEVLEARKIVLPGVGAFAVAIEKLKTLNLIEPMIKAIQSDKPFLGICLGLQLLFSESEEAKGVKGLSVFKGAVKKFTNLKVPHIGWNQIKKSKDGLRLLDGVNDKTNMYFCHSYFVEPLDKGIIATTTDYGIEFASMVSKKNVFGVQFHPEKSQIYGLKILENFVKL